MNLETDSNGHVLPITDKCLRLEHIPDDNCSFEDFVQFAHTFDGYELFGEEPFAACENCDPDGDDLPSLRNFLYTKARGWRHGGGPEPGEGGWEEERRALRSIRRILSAQDSSFTLTLQLLLEQSGVDLSDALIMRHTPSGDLGVAYPLLAATDLEAFNAYQGIQSPFNEKRLKQKQWLISFVVDGIGQTVLAGVFRIAQPVDDPTKLQAANDKLSKFGFAHTCSDCPLWFDLVRTEHLGKFRGRLVIEWHNPISWCRNAGSSGSVFEVTSISPESLLVPPKLPDWRTIRWTWKRLKSLPQSWRIAISQWRAVYFLHDSSSNKGYVGSAYGAENLLTRWEGYAATGHNDNKFLKPLDPDNFTFSILDLLDPIATVEEVTRRESTWKKRLQTLHPEGLNGNP